jgi:branched-chain amino acid transport system ATP-binding protein
MSEIPSRAAGGSQSRGESSASVGTDPLLLEIADVTMRFGGIVALEGVTFAIAAGRIVGLIGPNGAGKTTLFNCLSRLYRPVRGDIRLNGHSLQRCAPSDIAALGVGRTFQAPTLFASMSVLDNVKVGAHARGTSGVLSDAVTLPLWRPEERQCEETARAMLAFVGLAEAAAQPAATLSLGARKRVELARALAAKPMLLLLDEPAGGLNHEEVAELGGLIRSVRDQLGITVLLVEHHMGLVMSLSDQVVVLNFGRVIADGPPAEVRANPAVAEAYLGTRH